MSAFDHSLYAMREDAEDDLYKDGLELIFDGRTLTSSSPGSEELELASLATSDDFFRGIGASPTSDEFFLGLEDDEGMIYEEDEEDEEKKDDTELPKPQLKSKQKKRPTEEDNKARLQRCLNLSVALFNLSNGGDLEGVRAFVTEAFDQNCTLKTHALKEPLTGREHVIDCFERLLDQFPDGVYKLRTAFLAKNGDVVFKYGFDGTSTCTLPGFKGNRYMISFPDGKCPLQRVGHFAKMIMAATRRYWFPCERDKLTRTEELMFTRKALGHLSFELTGRMGFAPAHACSSPLAVRATRLELNYKVKSLKAKHADIMSAGAGAGAGAGAAGGVEKGLPKREQ